MWDVRVFPFWINRKIIPLMFLLTKGIDRGIIFVAKDNLDRDK